eukprot:GHVL01015126.1.p1 GENE.GHVL01015126.1~~GHVL01015126.1.p1  ORF type:complete len:115 (+),score=17.75 GHVL01015126.1:321-665(+)
MYQRCIADKTGMEPRKLFNLTQFLMFDSKANGVITVEQTLQILFVRVGREKLDSEIQAIFGKNEKTADGQEKRIGYSEFLVSVEERLEKLRKTKKGVSYPAGTNKKSAMTPGDG